VTRGRGVGLALLHEACKRGAGKLLVGRPIMASWIGDGSADCEARKQESQSKAFHGFLPKVGLGKLRLASRRRDVALGRRLSTY